MDPQETLQFNLFNPQNELHITERRLPHWFQPGASVFWTMRFLDSLPSEAIERIEAEVIECLWRNDPARRNAANPTTFSWSDYRNLCQTLQPEIRRKVQEKVSQQVNIELDKCHGECWFRRPELAQIMADVLLYHNSDRYDLDSFVIMPNHVHILFQFRDQNCFETIRPSWLRYSARLINQHLGRKGSLWQPEPFDHLVRNADEFEKYQRYIAANPTNAHLRTGEYFYWKR
jgi:putative transposase